MIFQPEFEHVLRHWMVHDSWNASEAFALMSCIDPSSVDPNSNGQFLESYSIKFAFSDCESLEEPFFYYADDARRQYGKLWDL